MLKTGAGLSYRSIAAGCFVTLVVSVNGRGRAGDEGTTTSNFGCASGPRGPVRVEFFESASAPTAETSPEQSPAAMSPEHGTKPVNKTPTQPVKKVDLNNASLAELKTLPTVGDAEAKKIIAHRPYKSKGELVTKAGLPEGVYHAVKHKVELQAQRQTAPKK